ncbi:hypothetical protein [Rhodococcus sp. SMB37]|uniref:hypothetical protein n=1 Tax=Rhodococcus sp. SMB37 TaxID=2512213 RepID=UPI001053E10A|nr:hypothetical protein [Rhodococcus sp. SMB37]
MDASSESLLHHTYFVETRHYSHQVHQKISGTGHSTKAARSMIAGSIAHMRPCDDCSLKHPGILRLSPQSAGPEPSTGQGQYNTTTSLFEFAWGIDE